MMMMMMMIALGFCFLWSPWEPHIPMNLRYFGSSWNSSCQRPMVRHSRLWKRWSLRFVKWDSLPVFKETICWLFLPNIYTYIWPQLYDVNLWCLRTIHGRVFVIYDICMALFCVLSDNFSPTSIWNRKSQVEPWKTTRKIPCNMKSWLVKNKSLHFLGEISEEKNKGGIMPYIYIYIHIMFNQPDCCSLAQGFIWPGKLMRGSEWFLNSSKGMYWNLSCTKRHINQPTQTHEEQKLPKEFWYHCSHCMVFVWILQYPT